MLNSIKKQNAKDELAARWHRVKLGEVVTLLRGAASITKKDLNNKGKNKCIHYGQLYTTYGQVIKNTKSYTNVDCHTKSKSGDVLIPGSTTADAMGIATASALLENDVIIGGDINVLRINKKLTDAVYLAHLLSNGLMKKQLASYARGTNILHLLGRDIIKIDIPLPPLNRQKQIASIISTWDDAIEKTELLIAAQERQFKGLINSLLNDKAKQTNWTLASLGEICDIKNGSTPRKTEESFWENGDIPWFTVADIRRQGRIINNTTQFITKEALKKSSISLLPQNSVLICCTASIGEHAFTTIPLTTNQQFNGLTIKKGMSQNIYPKYLFYASYLLKRELNKLGGKTSFTHVPISLVAKIDLLIPPIKEQEKIIACLSTCQNIINKSQKLLNEYKQQKKALIQKLFYCQ